MATTSVEMGETGLERAGGLRLQACGLGACVGLCLYEPAAQVALLVHVVLPQTLPAASGRDGAPRLPGKCADTALLHALAEISRCGGQSRFVRAALIGGAQIFSPSPANGDPAALSGLEIGPRNVAALKEQLARVGVPLCAEDTGGHGGRTVTLEAGTGHVWVRPVGLPERLLTTLGRRSEPLTSPAFAAPAHGLREGAAYGN